MVAEVEGSAIRTAPPAASAAPRPAIQLRSEIEGPVSAIDRAAGTLTVLGQLVHVGPATVFEDTLRGGLASLAVGQVVEIHGLLRAPASTAPPASSARMMPTTTTSCAAWSATSIARRKPCASAGADPPDRPVRRLAWGARRRGAGACLQASARAPLPASGSAEWRACHRLHQRRRFAVNGVAVDAGGVAQLPAGLALGSRVEVKGVLQSGMLVAREVELEDDADGGGFEVEGRITSINPGAQTLQLHGVSVYYAGARFKGGTAAQLAVGVKVEVKGPLAADGSTIVAQEIEFDD